MQKIKKKIINFMTLKGKKAINEKNLKTGFKNIQKISKKSTKDLMKTILIETMVPFKILAFKRKKRKKKIITEIPFFLKTHEERLFLAIKNFVQILKTKTNISINKKISGEFLLKIKKNEYSNFFKKKTQDSLLNKKLLTKFFKW